MKRLALLLLALTVHGPVRAAEPASGGLFRPDDRWLFLGDSITQNGAYASSVYLYYATRFPDGALQAASAGISGDSAGGALRRYEWDVRAQKPSVVTVMFGMNDVGRGFYGEASPSAEVLARRAAALDQYRRDMRALVSRLRSDGVRVVLLTPSPFDDTAESDRPRQLGVNTALGECAAFLRELAAETGSGLVDFHGPMTSINARLQAAEPRATIIGADRVHPGAPGHLLMAWLLLKAQGAPALVSAIEIDARAARVVAEKNAAVSDLAPAGGGLTFTVRAASLPYPFHRDALDALAWAPIREELNHESLRITGLPAGDYELHIDGVRIRAWSAGELAAGVDLAAETDTPQSRQAARVLGLVREWRDTVSSRLRVIPQVEHWHLRDVPQPVEFATVRERLSEQMERLRRSEASMDRYNFGIIERYLHAKPEEANIRAHLADLERRIRSTSRPQAHVYRLVPTPHEKR